MYKNGTFDIGISRTFFVKLGLLFFRVLSKTMNPHKKTMKPPLTAPTLTANDGA